MAKDVQKYDIVVDKLFRGWNFNKFENGLLKQEVLTLTSFNECLATNKVVDCISKIKVEYGREHIVLTN